VDVINTGSRTGDEVPQMYIHEKVASVTRPVKLLKGFERVTLQPGEKKTVEFTITPDSLSFLNTDMHRVVEPGDFEIMVGPNSQQTSTVILKVLGGSSVQSAPAPVGSESGLVSDFDDLKVTARYGGWVTTSDQEIGGKSTASMQAVEGGANGSRGALQVTGEIIPGAPFSWAGVIFHPGSSPETPANLSSKKTVSFWAKGDGKNNSFFIQTEANQGSMPVIQPFEAGPEWKQYSFSISGFNTDGHDIIGLGFAHAGNAGKFEFEIDDLEIK
jgi:hypothetical protein